MARTITVSYGDRALGGARGWVGFYDGTLVSAAFSVIGVAAGLITLGVVQGRVGLWLSVALVSLGMAQMFPALVGITLERVSVADRPLALSTFVMFFEVGSALGGASGWLVDNHGYPVTFVVAGCVGLGGLGFLGARPATRRSGDLTHTSVRSG